MTTALLIGFSAVVVLVLVRAVLRHHHLVPDVNSAANSMQALDLEAFRNLVDPVEEDYLRNHLSPEVFHSIQRKRMRAALEYVRRTAYNAAILLHLGEAARQNSNPQLATAAGELIADAMQLRINAKLAILVLYTRIVFPGAHISVGRVTRTHEMLASGLRHLGRLQDPAHARIA